MHFRSSVIFYKNGGEGVQRVKLFFTQEILTVPPAEIESVFEVFANFPSQEALFTRQQKSLAKPHRPEKIGIKFILDKTSTQTTTK